MNFLMITECFQDNKTPEFRFVVQIEIDQLNQLNLLNLHNKSKVGLGPVQQVYDTYYNISF